MPRRQVRFKILLDEMLPAREKFPELNNYHNVRHIVHDFGKSGLTDDKVIALAKKEGRIIVTKNIRHFRTTCRAGGVGLIGVSEDMPIELTDREIMAKLRKRKMAVPEMFQKVTRPPRRRSIGL